jgi:hypothetical protein
MLTKDAKTILKGGTGLFCDRVPLNVASFPFLPGRTVTMFGETGDTLGSTDYANRILEVCRCYCDWPPWEPI